MYKLLEFQGASWLQAKRFPFVIRDSQAQKPWSIWQGRTGTRAAPGYVSKRWEDGIAYAKAQK